MSGELPRAALPIHRSEIEELRTILPSYRIARRTNFDPRGLFNIAALGNAESQPELPPHLLWTSELVNRDPQREQLIISPYGGLKLLDVDNKSIILNLQVGKIRRVDPSYGIRMQQVSPSGFLVNPADLPHQLGDKSYSPAEWESLINAMRQGNPPPAYNQRNPLVVRVGINLAGTLLTAIGFNNRLQNGPELTEPSVTDIAVINDQNQLVERYIYNWFDASPWLQTSRVR